LVLIKRGGKEEKKKKELFLKMQEKKIIRSNTKLKTLCYILFGATNIARYKKIITVGEISRKENIYKHIQSGNRGEKCFWM